MMSYNFGCEKGLLYQTNVFLWRMFNLLVFTIAGIDVAVVNFHICMNESAEWLVTLVYHCLCSSAMGIRLVCTTSFSIRGVLRALLLQRFRFLLFGDTTGKYVFLFAVWEIPCNEGFACCSSCWRRDLGIRSKKGVGVGADMWYECGWCVEAL